MNKIPECKAHNMHYNYYHLFFILYFCMLIGNQTINNKYTEERNWC